MTIRRISRGAKPAPAHAPKLTEVKLLLKSIASTEKDIAALSDMLKRDMAALETAMQACSLETLTVEGATAEFVRPAGKAQNIIDPEKFFAKVGKEDFFSAISVLVVKAKELLGQKELDKITTRIPAKSGERKLKVIYSK